MTRVRMLPPAAWATGAALTMGVALLDMLAGLGHGVAAVWTVQLAVAVLVRFALCRAMAGRGGGAQGRALARFALFQFAWAGAIALASGAAFLLTAGRALADIWLWSFLAIMAADMVLLPFAPWGAALAIGDGQVGPGQGWRAIRSSFAAYAGAWATTVGPALAIALMLAILTLDRGSLPAGTALVGMVAVDATASLAEAVLASALAVAAWAVARERAEAVDGASFDN